MSRALYKGRQTGKGQVGEWWQAAVARGRGKGKGMGSMWRGAGRRWGASVWQATAGRQRAQAVGRVSVVKCSAARVRVYGVRQTAQACVQGHNIKEADEGIPSSPCLLSTFDAPWFLYVVACMKNGFVDRYGTVDYLKAFFSVVWISARQGV